jgi:glycosyltransferase involved in cell wall biosynthesis
MKCGAPVVVGNATSLPEVVGDAALQVDPFDVSAIAGAMDQLINNSELRAELSVKGQERAKIFDWKVTAQRTLAVYEQVHQESYRTAAG